MMVVVAYDIATSKGGGAKRLRVTHHDPQHTDAMLAPLDAALQTEDSAFRFAREGETVEL